MKPKLISLCIGLLSLTAVAQQPPAYSDAEAGAHAGEEAAITGMVVTVSTSAKGTTFLNFGDRYPRHTFSGVVLARNEAAVGDMTQYEGKEVTLTGRIEMSPDQKPQIVISSPDQISLVGAHPPGDLTPAPLVAPPPTIATPPVVATAPTIATAPSDAPPMTVASVPTRLAKAPPEMAEPEKDGKSMGKIALAMNWKSGGQGGEMVRKDLAKLFGESGSASELTVVDTSFDIYPGIRFLTPLTEATRILHLDGAPSSNVRISTAGMPQGSFTAVAFSGIFAGGFTRIYLITDNADQVVSVLVVDANTRTRTPNETDTTGYHTYNFVTGGAKAVSDHLVRHQISAESSSADVVVVDTLFIDPKHPENPSPLRSSKSSSSFSKPKTGKVLERSRWFVPEPIVNLILRSVVQ